VLAVLTVGFGALVAVKCINKMYISGDKKEKCRKVVLNKGTAASDEDPGDDDL
jgi:hypothetical protein